MSTEKSIIKVIAYFDVFDYPITEEEIFLFLDQPYSKEAVDNSLKLLLQRKTIWKLYTFYSLQNDSTLIERRIKGNIDARKQIQFAKRIAKFISWFPFVRGVAISGSLSKNFSYSGSDYDFFIITATNRMWIPLAALGMVTKVFFWMNSRKYLCLNYIVDETAMELEDKNIYTAAEVMTIIPCFGKKVFEKYFSINSWGYVFFPNNHFQNKGEETLNENIIKQFTEWALRNEAGEKLNNWWMNKLQKRWAKMKTKNIVTKKGQIQGDIHSSLHYCKRYPPQFQMMILEKYEQRVNDTLNLLQEQMA